MNYNNGVKLLLAALLLAAAPSKAADPKPDAAAAPAEADATTLQVVDVVLKTPTSDVDPRLIDPFMAVKPESLPKKLRLKVQEKQIEISTLIRLHDTKKKGTLIQPAEGCDEKSFVLPLSQKGIYQAIQFVDVNEDELKYVMDTTKCTEVDLGCRFSLKIFYTKPKPRALMFHENDPIMALVAASHGGGTGTHFFGMGLTCMH
jgi:hypothetical protein